MAEKAILRRAKKAEEREGRNERRERTKNTKGGNMHMNVCLERTHSTAREALRAKFEVKAALREKRKREAGR